MKQQYVKCETCIGIQQNYIEWRKTMELYPLEQSTLDRLYPILKSEYRVGGAAYPVCENHAKEFAFEQAIHNDIVIPL